MQAYSRQANDLAQILFALYVAIAVTQATRCDAHLAAGAFAARYPEGVRRNIARASAALVLVPWALFVIITSAPEVWRSLLQLERFPDTLNPGYFLVRAAALFLALLVLLQAVLDLFAPRRSGP